MVRLDSYLEDGAGYQAQAVLCVLKGLGPIEESYDASLCDYEAEINVARWENCREQGYVITLRKGISQLNIAFFEHRNSDDICAVKWEQMTINAPTIDTAEFGDVYKTKGDISYSVKYGQFVELARWIKGELTAFWVISK